MLHCPTQKQKIISASTTNCSPITEPISEVKEFK